MIVPEEGARTRYVQSSLYSSEGYQFLRTMKSSNYQQRLRLGAYSPKECQLPSPGTIDLGACLNIGEHGTLGLALAIIDCRLVALGKGSSGCFLRKDKPIITCPGSTSGVSSQKVVDVLLEVFDACHQESLKFYRDQTTLLSSVLGNLTKEAVLRYSSAREDLRIVLWQIPKLTAILQDNLLVGKELLKYVDSLPDLNHRVQKLSIEFQDAPEEFREERRDDAKEGMHLDIILLPRQEQLVDVLGKNTDVERLNYAEHLYCTFCRCLFVYLTSKALGALTGVAVLLLTILTAMQASFSDFEAGDVVLETILSQVLLLTMFLFGGDARKRKISRTTSTRSSRNSPQSSSSQLLR